MMKENVPWMPGLYVSVDGDIFELRNNNWVSNLYWCTPKENTEKAVREGRMKPGDKRGDKHPKSKYSNELKIKIYKFYQKTS